MKTLLFLVATTLESSAGFAILPSSTRMTASLKISESEITPSASDPFRIVDLDMEHAKDCADHFGKCSVKELKQIKEDLHQHRIQNIVFGETAPEDTFQTRMIEEEISLQLNLLQDEMPPSTLFPKEDSMAELPHKHEDVELENKVKKEQRSFLLEEMVEEGVMDSLAICALIGLLMFAPQFL